MTSPYLGSTISLTSRSELRYMGTLISIDTTKSTVTLQHVRSFGTEGRKGGVDEVPPSSEVYDCIVFRAADIRDLSVQEAPPQHQNMYAPPQVSPY